MLNLNTGKKKSPDLGDFYDTLIQKWNIDQCEGRKFLGYLFLHHIPKKKIRVEFLERLPAPLCRYGQHLMVKELRDQEKKKADSVKYAARRAERKTESARTIEEIIERLNGLGNEEREGFLVKLSPWERYRIGKEKPECRVVIAPGAPEEQRVWLSGYYEAIMSRWRPKNKRNCKMYLKHVLERGGIHPDYKVELLKHLPAPLLEYGYRVERKRLSAENKGVGRLGNVSEKGAAVYLAPRPTR